jgi:hypothetical protein
MGAGVVGCSCFIFHLNRNINFKLQFLCCATIALSERYSLPHAAFPALTGCVMIMKATGTVKKGKREINVSLNKCQALLMHKTVKTIH